MKGQRLREAARIARDAAGLAGAIIAAATAPALAIAAAIAWIMR